MFYRLEWCYFTNFRILSTNLARWTPNTSTSGSSFYRTDSREPTTTCVFHTTGGASSLRTAYVGIILQLQMNIHLTISEDSDYSLRIVNYRHLNFVMWPMTNNPVYTFGTELQITIKIHHWNFRETNVSRCHPAFSKRLSVFNMLELYCILCVLFHHFLIFHTHFINVQRSSHF